MSYFDWQATACTVYERVHVAVNSVPLGQHIFSCIGLLYVGSSNSFKPAFLFKVHVCVALSFKR